MKKEKWTMVLSLIAVVLLSYVTFGVAGVADTAAAIPLGVLIAASGFLLVASASRLKHA